MMTEQEWLNATDARVMLDAPLESVSNRRWWFLIRTGYLLWRSVSANPYDAASIRQVSSGRSFLQRLESCPEWDGGTEVRELSLTLLQQCKERAVAEQDFERAARLRSAQDQWHQSPNLHLVAQDLYRATELWDPFDPKPPRLAELIRDVLGNPFCPATVGNHWLTPSVTGLAGTIYTEWCFEEMPILADALEEAGCDHDEILEHCRGDGPHVRGCWVIDLILGRE